MQTDSTLASQRDDRKLTRRRGRRQRRGRKCKKGRGSGRKGVEREVEAESRQTTYSRRADLGLDIGEEDLPPEVEELHGLVAHLVAGRKAARLGVDLLVPGFRWSDEVDHANRGSEALHRWWVRVEGMCDAVVCEWKVPSNVLRRPVREVEVQETLLVGQKTSHQLP